MATNLPSCFSIEFLEQLLKFLVNFTLLKYVESQRSYGILITKELIFGFQILDLKDHFSASLKVNFSLWAIDAFHAMHSSNILSCFFRNLIQRSGCITLRRLIFFHCTACSLRTVRRSFSQLVKVEPKRCVVKMGITCQNLTNHRISRNRDTGF